MPSPMSLEEAWETTTTVCLLYVAIVVPFQVAFTEQAALSTFFWIGICIDLIFFVDMVLRFFIPTRHDRMTGQPLDRRTIAMNYVRSWLLIDAMSIFPLDLITLGKSSGRVESFRALKAVRLLRLMKLAKIMRASQILSRLQSRLDIDYASLTLASYLAYFLFGAHWLACLVHLVASWQRTFYPNEEFLTWIDVLELETGSSLDSTVGQYIASLYWATVTMTNMGLGDTHAHTNSEKVAMVPVAAASCCYYAYIVGGVFGLVGRLAEEQHIFTSELTKLNAFMRHHNLDNAMRIKIREFLHYKWREKQKAGVEVGALALSSGLTEAVFAHTHIPNLSLLPPFRHTSTPFLSKLCENMKANAFSSGDFIIPSGRPVKELHLLESGLVMTGSRVQQAPAGIGMAMLVSTRPAAKGSMALSLCRSSSIDYETWQKLLAAHPRNAAVIRKNVLKDVVREGIIQYTQMVLNALPLMMVPESAAGQRSQWKTLENVAAGVPAAHLQSLLDIQLQIVLYDAQRAGKWHQSVCVIQRFWRFKRFAARVADDLQHRSLDNPMLLLLSDALHMHAIGKYYEVLVGDCHDSWTLTQCTAKELQQAYGLPLQRASDLLHTLQQNPELHPVPRYAQRNVSQHFSRAVLRFMQIAHNKGFQRKVASGEMERQLQECKVTACWADHLVKQREELVGSGVAPAVSGLESYTALPSYPLSRSFLLQLLHSESQYSGISSVTQ